MTRSSSLLRRYALRGALFGLALAAVWLTMQATADLDGRRIVGPAELMFVTSLPASLLTWASLLWPLATIFGDGASQTPSWVAYLWMLVTPVLNWAGIGAFVGWRRDRQIARTDALGAHG